MKNVPHIHASSHTLMKLDIRLITEGITWCVSRMKVARRSDATYVYGPSRDIIERLVVVGRSLSTPHQAKTYYPETGSTKTRQARYLKYCLQRASQPTFSPLCYSRVRVQVHKRPQEGCHKRSGKQERTSSEQKVTTLLVVVLLTGQAQNHLEGAM